MFINRDIWAFKKFQTHDLYNNQIENVCSIQIAKALYVKFALHTLNLSDNQIKDDG